MQINNSSITKNRINPNSHKIKMIKWKKQAAKKQKQLMSRVY